MSVPRPPKPFRLTSRDQTLLTALLHYRVLRRDQVQRLLFPSKNTANQRLQLLSQHRFVARRRLPVEYGWGSGQAIYMLASRGACLVSEYSAVDLADIGWRRAQNHVSTPFLQHTLMVNDVRVSVAQGCHSLGASIPLWLRDDQLRVHPEEVCLGTGLFQRRRVSLIPDAYFRLTIGDLSASFCLEIDRATETNGRWAAKIQSYLAYIRSGAYRRRYDSRSLRVLCVSTSAPRLWNLMRTTARVCDAYARGLFWFAVLQDAGSPDILERPVWRVPDVAAPLPLLVPESAFPA